MVYITIHIFTSINYFTYLDPHPIVGFSHLSLASNSSFHSLLLTFPDCIALRAGRNTRTFLVTMWSSGTPVNEAES